MKTDELTRDLLASHAGAAIVEAAGGPKGLAMAGGFGVRHARRIRNGDRSNPAYRVLEMLRAVKDPWALVRLFLAVVVEREIEELHGPLSEAKVRQLWADTCQAEWVTDADEDVEDGRFNTLRSSTLAELYQKDAAHVRVQLRRLALNLICQRHGWDPRAPLLYPHETRH